MGSIKVVNRLRWFCLGLILALPGGLALAQEVSLVGIFGTARAVLLIGDSGPRTMRVGDTVAGVSLLEIGKEQVLIRRSDGVQTVRIGDRRRSRGGSSEAVTSVTLIADSHGYFRGRGAINGSSVAFLVDTGASMVTLDQATARRLGMDLADAEVGVALTANGSVPIRRIRLAQVSLGDLVLTEVEAAVLPSDLPQVLLGASFLNRLEMHREGSTMVLRLRNER